MTSDVLRVLGVDPGTRVTGWGVVDRQSGGLVFVGCGTIRPPVEATPAQRLSFVHKGLLEVLAEQTPDAVAVAEAFFGRNVRSAIRLAEARAVCLLASELSGHPVHELPPALIKKAVTGNGQASKETVRRAVLALLGWEGDRLPAYDATDALAANLLRLDRLGLSD